MVKWSNFFIITTFLQTRTKTMERKRPTSFSYKDVSTFKKKRKSEESSLEDNTRLPDSNVHLPNDTLASIHYIKSIFPQKIFEGLIPPIILKHQIYSVVKDKTVVDREINKLWKERKVQLFKLISGSDEFALVLTEDFVAHVKMKAKSENFNLLEKFLGSTLPECVDVSVSKQNLVDQHKFTDKEITVLVNNGLLQCRDVGSWWLGIPGAGVFMKHFTKGRQSILQKIKRRKFKEILQQDLEKHKLLASKLGILYHIYDITGAELVKSIPTTSGPLLRLVT